jgi:hypothetical protein
MRSGMPTGDDFPNTTNITALAQQMNAAWALVRGSWFQIAIIALAAMNLAAAIDMIGIILYDAWTVRKWIFETNRR